MQANFETIFDVIYLIFVITLGLIMVRRSKGNQDYFLFGIMAITLGLGDSFHLIPRAVALNSSGQLGNLPKYSLCYHRTHHYLSLLQEC